MMAFPAASADSKALRGQIASPNVVPLYCQRETPLMSVRTTCKARRKKFFTLNYSLGP